MNQGEELRYLALAIQREGNRQLTEALRGLKLTPAQTEVFLVLQQYQPMTLIELGDRLVCETGSPSRLIKSMVEAGWVEKSTDPNDGRAIRLQLSPQANAILPELNQVNDLFNEHVAASFSDDTLDLLLKYLWPLAADTPSGQALMRRKNNL